MAFKMSKNLSKIFKNTKPSIMYEENTKKKATIHNHL